VALHLYLWGEKAIRAFNLIGESLAIRKCSNINMYSNPVKIQILPRALTSPAGLLRLLMLCSRLLFGCTVFLGSFLLFLVEPIAAKQLLPTFGGSAAVWITCLVFFQTALLIAYLYAHWLAHRSRWSLHLLLLLAAAASALVWATTSISIHPQHPITAIFLTLGITIGLPFLMLGATSPLLQVWLARLEMRGIPYRLYALSNLASLLALGLYPTLIEPYFTLRMQRLLWCGGFAAFAVVSAVLTWKTRARNGEPSDAEEPTQDEASIPAAPLGHKILWVLLPMGAAMQLSAVTSYLTANIAAIPLLWILPLGVYLITLILAFEYPKLIPRGLLIRFWVVIFAALAYLLTNVNASLPMRIAILFFLIEVFFACLFCHSEAYALRPKRASESTLFYLLFAAGGALGSSLVGIASPLLFSFNYDLAITFLVCALLALAVTWSTWSLRLLWTVASILLMVLLFFLHTAYQRDTPWAVRNFYGSLHVRQSFSYPGTIVRTLSNGNIQHGLQIFSPELSRTPTTYYAEDSGVGLALRNCCEGRARRIGVVGLGVGTVAAYGHTGDQIRFYEINPAVTPIARNVFTYLRDSAAQVSVVEGDARATLAIEAPQQYDVMVIDAFSGDAIPLHLLTTEAVALYRRHLAAGGILAFHISNQHVDLEPEIALLAKAAGMKAVRVSSLPNPQRGAFASTWMLVTNNETFLAMPEVVHRAHQPADNAKVRLWTDDYSSLLPILHW